VGDAPAAPGVGVTKYPDDETYPGLLVLRFDADRTLLTVFSARRRRSDVTTSVELRTGPSPHRARR
jgi:hypothetical protein